MGCCGSGGAGSGEAMRYILTTLAVVLATLGVATAGELSVRATAYCLRGRTATGTRAGPGAIAVDPRVIPLGSRVYVPGYGWGRAVDTGRLIRGRRVDVWLPSRGGCMRWGVRKVRVRWETKRR